MSQQHAENLTPSGFQMPGEAEVYPPLRRRSRRWFVIQAVWTVACIVVGTSGTHTPLHEALLNAMLRMPPLMPMLFALTVYGFVPAAFAFPIVRLVVALHDRLPGGEVLCTLIASVALSVVSLYAFFPAIM